MKADQAKEPEKAKAGKERFVKILKGCGFNGLVALAGKIGLIFKDYRIRIKINPLSYEI